MKWRLEKCLLSSSSSLDRHHHQTNLIGVEAKLSAIREWLQGWVGIFIQNIQFAFLLLHNNNQSNNGEDKAWLEGQECFAVRWWRLSSEIVQDTKSKVKSKVRTCSVTSTSTCTTVHFQVFSLVNSIAYGFGAYTVAFHANALSSADQPHSVVE